MQQICVQRDADLCLDDVLNVRKRYGSQSEGDRIKWAVLGGGAVKFLLDADHVEGRETQNQHIHDGRQHKDLDLYLFGDENLKGLAYLPLEVFAVDNLGPLRRLNYHRVKVPKNSFFVETARGYNFGFQTPSQEDIVAVDIESERIYTVSPEFAIASRLFDTSGLRHTDEGRIDEEDAEKLYDKFRIQSREVRRLQMATPFSFLPEEFVYALPSHLRERTFEPTVAAAIKTKYRNSGLDLEQMTYNELVSLLNYSPMGFQNDINQDHFRVIVERMQDGPSNQKPGTLLAVRYLLGSLSQDLVEGAIHEYFHSGVPNPTNFRKIMIMMNAVRVCSNPLSVGSRAAQVMRKYKHQGEIVGYDGFNPLVVDVGRGLLTAPFYNVRLALFEERLKESQRVPDPVTGFSLQIGKLYSEGWMKP